MEIRYYYHENYDINYFPSKNIKLNETNNYFDNNFGFDRVILLS